MSKRLMIGAAIGALMVSTALAQAPSSPASSPMSPPAASSDKSTTSAKLSGSKADFIAAQKSDQFVASKFKGTDVLGPDNQKVGDVSDILFDKDGKIEAYVVSVGGFLGMGSKEVALAPSSFDLVPGENGSAPKLKISMTKDELKNAQNFARYEPPRPTTTGSGPSGLGGGSRPMGGAPGGAR